MTKKRCDLCDRTFKDEAGLAQHRAAKHPVVSITPKKIIPKKVLVWIISIAILGLLVLGIAVIIPETAVKELNVVVSDPDSIPSGAVHWHPSLTIIINGERISIPNGIGHTKGRVIDVHLSGMRMSPTHTHEERDGTIHLENNNPSSKPETVTLGYFFYVWDKPFNATCIFEYCTDKGTLRMKVNGEESTAFGNYIMRDKDNIRIEYTSFKYSGEHK